MCLKVSSSEFFCRIKNMRAQNCFNSKHEDQKYIFSHGLYYPPTLTCKLLLDELCMIRFKKILIIKSEPINLLSC